MQRIRQSKKQNRNSSKPNRNNQKRITKGEQMNIFDKIKNEIQHNLLKWELRNIKPYNHAKKE